MVIRAIGELEYISSNFGGGTIVRGSPAFSIDAPRRWGRSKRLNSMVNSSGFILDVTMFAKKVGGVGRSCCSIALGASGKTAVTLPRIVPDFAPSTYLGVPSTGTSPSHASRPGNRIS